MRRVGPPVFVKWLRIRIGHDLKFQLVVQNQIKIAGGIRQLLQGRDLVTGIALLEATCHVLGFLCQRVRSWSRAAPGVPNGMTNCVSDLNASNCSWKASSTEKTIDPDAGYASRKRCEVRCHHAVKPLVHFAGQLLRRTGQLGDDFIRLGGIIRQNLFDYRCQLQQPFGGGGIQLIQ